MDRRLLYCVREICNHEFAILWGLPKYFLLMVHILECGGISKNRRCRFYAECLRLWAVSPASRSLIQTCEFHMPETEVDTFAGIDVSARELSVALQPGRDEDDPPWLNFLTISRLEICWETRGNLISVLRTHCLECAQEDEVQSPPAAAELILFLY
jgi:hypothetical protein